MSTFDEQRTDGRLPAFQREQQVIAAVADVRSHLGRLVGDGQAERALREDGVAGGRRRTADHTQPDHGARWSVHGAERDGPVSHRTVSFLEIPILLHVLATGAGM